MEAWCVAFVTTVLAILCNKYLMSGWPEFRYPTTLAAAHFALAAAVSSVCVDCGWGLQSEPNGCAGAERLPPWYITAAFVIVSSAAAVLSNASLLLNTVAYYQGMNLAGLSLVALAEIWAGTKQFDVWHPILYAVITLGVDMMIGAGWAVAPIALHVGLAASAAAGAQQFFCAWLQARWDLSPLRLLSIASPFQAALLLAIGPVADAALFGGRVFKYSWTPGAAFILFVTCVLATQLSFWQCASLKSLGPSTHQALTQLTTAPILVVASLCFSPPKAWHLSQRFGAALAAGAAGGLACYEQWLAEERECDAAEPLLPLVK